MFPLCFILRKNCSSQTKNRIIGNKEGFFFILGSYERSDRTKELFIISGHPLRYICQNRGRIVCPWAIWDMPSQKTLSAQGNALAHLRVERVTQVYARQGTHLRFFIHRVTHESLFH